VRPGAQYAASGFHRLLLGSGHRPLWTAPLRVQVLDLARVAGGLEPIERGGGRQTKTLHLRGGDGKRYVFRSVDKFVEQVLPEDLQRTPVENLVQDQISAFHPTGALVLPPLLEAARVLHVRPMLVVLPDDPRLGEHRSEFAGMLGWFEERPSDGPDGTPGFAGATRVESTEDLLEELREEGGRVEAREYLAARLIDFLVGDTDRGPDQWRWALAETGDGVPLWRPIPRDRDWAFLRTTGLLPGLARTMLPKQVTFGPRLPSLRSLLISSLSQDRRFLAELPLATVDSMATALWQVLDERVISAAVSSLPPEHDRFLGAALQHALRYRREALPATARELYRELAREVDVHGTDGSDQAKIEFTAGGDVVVELHRPTTNHAVADGSNGGAAVAAAPYFRRAFIPAETREVRIYLSKGDDVAVVRGAGPAGMSLRIVGGEGDDILTDSTRASGARVSFHDAEGRNTFIAAERTRVDRRPFDQPGDSASWIGVATGSGRYRDWGSTRSLLPAVDYVEGSGLVLGAALRGRRYGFRHVPFEFQWQLSGSFSPGTGGFGLEAALDRYFSNSPFAATRGSQTRAVRSPLRRAERETVTADWSCTTRPAQRHATSQSAATERGALASRGPRTQPESPPRERSAEVAGPAGSGHCEVEPCGAVSCRVAHRVLAWRLCPPCGLPVGSVRPKRAARLPDRRATLAPGRRWSGLSHSALCWRTMKWRYIPAFAGDAALHGSAELRAPLGRIALLTRGQLGALALADAGRVYLDGASPGGWHTAVGGGLWFTTADLLTVNLTYARGEAGKLYLALGLPF
jgi:hypothetical protein